MTDLRIWGALAITAVLLGILLRVAIRREEWRRMFELVQVVDGVVTRPARSWLQRIVGPVIVEQGTIAPWWVGVAYRRFNRHDAVCFVVPLNWLVMLVVVAWWRWRRLCGWAPDQRFTHADLQAAMEQAYQVGRKDGYDMGRAVCAESHHEIERRAVSDFAMLAKTLIQRTPEN